MLPEAACLRDGLLPSGEPAEPAGCSSNAEATGLATASIQAGGTFTPMW